MKCNVHPYCCTLTPVHWCCESDNLTAGAEQFAASQALYAVDGDGSSSAGAVEQQHVAHLALGLTNTFSMCCLGVGLLVLTSCGALFVVSGVVGASTIAPDDLLANALGGDANADEWQSCTTSSSRPTSLTLSVRPARAIRASPAHRSTLAVVPEVSSFSINDPTDDDLSPRPQPALDEVLLQAQRERSGTHLHSRDDAQLLRTGRFCSSALALLALLSQVWVWFGLTTVFQGLCDGGLTAGCPDIWQQLSYIATGHFIVSASGAFIAPPGDDVLKPEKHGMSPLV